MNKPSIISFFVINETIGFFLHPYAILPRKTGEKYNRIYISQDDQRIYIFSKTKEDIAKNLKKLKRFALKFLSACRKNAKEQFKAAQNADFTKMTFEEVTDNDK